ncbi:putative reverse transcriptase domain-containing protein [Tanacetum coccineum]
MLATKGSEKVTTMEALTNNTKGIRCLGHTMLGQTTRNMLGPYLYATSENVTTMDHALTPAAAEYQRTLTCYECGGLGHYKRDCLELKNQNHGNQSRNTEAREMVHALGGETNQDIDNLEDDINA